MSDDNETEEPGQVISLATGKPLDTDAAPSAEHGAYCHHGMHGWSVNTVKRTLKCQRCQADIDPIDALSDIARHFDRVRDARAEYLKLSETLKRLRDEEKRIKVRMQNASRKDATVAVKVALEHARTRNETIASWADQIGELSDRIANATGTKVYSRRRKMQPKKGTSP